MYSMSVIRQLKRILGVETENSSQTVESVWLSDDFVNQSEHAMNFLGYVQTDNTFEFVGITEEDFREHLTVFGQPGFGRQTVLQNSIYHLIDNGQGVCLIDKSGETVERIADAVSTDDIIVVEPGKSDGTGFNFFEISKDPGEKKFEKDVEYIISEFTKMTEIDEGAQMTSVTESIVSQLVRAEKTYSPKKFQQIISSTSDVQSFVESFEDGLSETEKELLLGLSEADLEPIRRRVDPFVENSLVSTVTSHESTSIPINEAVEDDMSILVSLKGVEDETTRETVAASITRQVWGAIQKRSYMGSDKYDEYSLALSEFGRFESDSLGFTDILPKSRAFELSVLVSAQQPGSLTEDSLNTIQNNCGNVVSTQIGKESESEIEFLANMLSLKDGEDLVGLDKYRCIGTVSMETRDRSTMEFNLIDKVRFSELD